MNVQLKCITTWQQLGRLFVELGGGVVWPCWRVGE